MSAIPVTLLIGQAAVRQGLLARWLLDPARADTLIVGHAGGALALAHPLVAIAAEEEGAGALGAGRLASVCACCVPQRGLARTLREAGWRFSRGGVRQFSRVLIDSGSTDPTPVLHTLRDDSQIASRYRLDGTLLARGDLEPPQAVDAAEMAALAAADVLAVPADAAIGRWAAWLALHAPEIRLCDAVSVLPEAVAAASGGLRTGAE